LVGRSDFSQYEGFTVKGSIDEVFIRGIHAYSKSDFLVKKEFGQFVKAKHTQL